MQQNIKVSLEEDWEKNPGVPVKTSENQCEPVSPSLSQQGKKNTRQSADEVVKLGFLLIFRGDDAR